MPCQPSPVIGLADPKHAITPDFLRVTCRSAAWLLLFALFAVAVYRAASQPIAHDESLEYTWFLDGGVLNALRFNSTNHVLFTLLAKPCVQFLGVTELTLRVPTLLGSVLYLIGAYLLSKELFGERIVMLVSVALLCLNPTLMDFMVAARGYGLGLGFLICAMYLVARQLRTDDLRHLRARCVFISILLALSVTANLTNLIPAFSLGVLFLICAWRRYSHSGLNLKSLVWDCVAPGAATGFVILWPFLIQARPSQFAMALPRLSDSLQDNFNSSFLYKWTGDIYSISLGAVPPSPGTWQKTISDLGVALFLPLLFLFVLSGFIFAWRTSSRPGKRPGDAFVFVGAVIGSAVLNWTLHVAIRMNYPVARTSVYFVPLLSIAAILTTQEISSRIRGAWWKILSALIAIVVIADYAACFNTKYFRYNEYDLISRQLFQSIYADARSRALDHVRIGGTWWYQPEIDFYTRRYHAAFIEPFDIVDRSYWWNSPDALPPADYNYFVFTRSNDPHLTGPAVRTIFHNGAFGVTVQAHDK